MMTNTINHLCNTQQPVLGTLAYWSAISAPMFNSIDRSSEKSVRVREGDGYA